MARRAKTVCRTIGCRALVETPGNCDEHTKEESCNNSFDDNKNQVRRKFYSTSRWTKASIRKRKMQPLCEHCLEKGRTKEAEMVHHEPSLEILLSKGLNPVDPQYLHSLCDECHREEHRVKRGN